MSEPRPRIAVVSFPGSLDDHDAVWALGALGADALAVWHAQPSFDKQYVRDYCESLEWDKTPPGPDLPDEVVSGTRARYVEASDAAEAKAKVESMCEQLLANPLIESYEVEVAE